MNRRQVLKLGLATAGAAALGCEGTPGFPETAGGGAAEPEGEPIAEPLAAFEVTHDSALIWTSSDHTELARIEITTAGDDFPAAASVQLRDGVVAVDVQGLAADTEYRYRAVFPHVATRWQTLRTAPDPDQPALVRFAFSADVRSNRTEIFEPLVAGAYDFYLNLGDWPYADDDPAPFELFGYRARHRAARRWHGIDGLLAATPLYCIYDDHEVRNNWDEKLRASEPDWVGAALAVWDEYFPTRGEHRYRSIRRGRNLELFVLDTRMFRSTNADPDGAAKTMLGAEQKAWLIDSIRASDARFKLVVTSVPLAYGAGNDGWWSYAAERDEIAGALAGLDGVLFLSADRHFFAALSHGGLREYHVGPLTAGVAPLPDDARGAEILRTFSGYNFGEITITPGDLPQLTFICRDMNGDAHWIESFVPADLRWG